MAVSACESEVTFTPSWGKNRLQGMLESRPDWCISRQRAWGLPIPAFKTPDGEILLTEKSVRCVAEKIALKGSDSWFLSSAEELLADYSPETDPDFNKSCDLTKCEKLYDIFDVWFESGASWEAVMGGKESNETIDLYLEGSDQHRGWFHLSLLLSLGSQQKAPYKHILTHGFIVDKHGKKMSKSLGNTISVETLLSQYGAEVTRWWVSSLAFENDIKVDLSFFDVAGDAYRKIRNTLRFLLSNIHDFSETMSNDTEKRNAFLKSLPPESPEAYILNQVSELIQTTKRIV